MRARATCGLVLAGAAAGAVCGGERVLPPEPSPWDTLGDTHYVPEPSRARESRAAEAVPETSSEQPPEAARDLAAAVAGLRDGLDPTHADVVLALEQLAEALVLLAPDMLGEIEQIRSAADQLRRSPRASLEHADLARTALDAAVRVLTTLEPSHPTPGWMYQRRVDESVRAVKAVDPSVPLLAQHATLVAAFAAIRDAVQVAFTGAESDGQTVAGRPARRS